MLATNEILSQKITALEQQLGEHNEQIQTLRFERQKMVEGDEKDDDKKIWFQAP